ncbi:MAG: Crp/Fnr family transcriptional regulator [Spirochaetales bacterium]|nr:Crp/Fnr family transcriptional regulator [Spirochaetales bacterium]
MNLNKSLEERFGKRYKKNEIIFCEFEPGDTCYLIQSGKVEIVKIMANLEKTIDILEPGEIFGEMAILEQAPRSATAIADENVELLEFNRENFVILMQGNPAIALKLLKLFTKRIYDQKRRFMILTLEETDAKVADVFIMLSERMPRDPLDGDMVEIEANVEDIAHWAGIPPSKCQEVINHFVYQGRIELFPNKIKIRNINDFVRFVNSKRKPYIRQ